MRLDGAVVWITGGARGIGLATAEAMSKRGAKIAIGDVNEEAAIESIATRLEEASKGANGRGKGPVHLVLTHPELPGEVEIALKQEYTLNPQIKGAIKHVPGVQMVEEF